MSEELDPVHVKNYKSDFDVNNLKRSQISQSSNQEMKYSSNHHKNAKSSLNLNTNNSKLRTQSVFNLTNSSQNFPNVRLFGMSQFQSSSSLQNSSYVWSFTKSNRHKGGVYKMPLTDSMYNLPDTKNGRYTTQGYGQRKDLRPELGKISPPPNTYKIKTCFDVNVEKRKGPLILDKIEGIPHPSTKFPGPGSYNVSTPAGLSKGSPIALKSRTMFFYDEDIAKQKHCISPQKYLPSTKLVENWRYNKITFGVGNRAFSYNNLSNPGPGAYDLPSVFDKKRKYKIPLN